MYNAASVSSPDGGRTCFGTLVDMRILAACFRIEKAPEWPQMWIFSHSSGNAAIETEA
jgi:hypothetical protein